MFGNNQPISEIWKPRALELARAKQPWKLKGTLREIHNELQDTYPGQSIGYDAVRLFLLKNGFSTGVKKSRKFSRTTFNPEPRVKNFGVITDGKYALVKMDRDGRIIGKPLPIDKEEALRIIEKKVF
jgi:hypothetical protein